jgi:S-DNA-T family DNA segregation ATPase FtsK/SpoIIIE
MHPQRRIGERKDVDLILGQGMLTSGWYAHTLNAPGKFLISAPEHDIPRRARAYLVTDEAVTCTAQHYAVHRPALDEISQDALTTRTGPKHADSAADGTPSQGRSSDAETGPEALLWAALSMAPAEGITVPELVSQTGMSRPWIYQRLRDLVRDSQAAQVTRGRWRTVADHSP